MFKVGQKVVFIGCNTPVPFDVKTPQVDDICEITGHMEGRCMEDGKVKFGYQLKGYERTRTNRTQYFEASELRPTQPAHEINTAAIAKELTLTPERLDVPTPIHKPVHEPQPA